MKDRLGAVMRSLEGKNVDEVIRIFKEFISSLTPEDSMELDEILAEELSIIGLPFSVHMDDIVLHSDEESSQVVMEKMLEDAIATEQYELAAELRDSLKKYEKKDTQI